MYEQYLRRPDVGERELAGVLRRLPSPTRSPVAPAAGPAARAGARRRAAGPGPAAPAAAPPRRRPPARRAEAGEPDPRRAAPRSSPTWRPASSVPTATSFREVPAKLLEVNRTRHQRLPRPHARRQGQLHPPHRLRRRAGHRRRRAGHELDVRRGRRRQAAGRPPRARRTSASPSTSRRPTAAARCSCPCIKRRRHARLPRRSGPRTRSSSARSAPTSSTPDDFAGATVTLTNPGTIGTVQSVPRLMPGQGVIVGVGAHRLPGRVPGRRPARRSPSSACRRS